MNVRLGGTFTYDELSDLIVLRVYLQKTRPTTDLLVKTEALDGSGRMVAAAELWLQSRCSQRAFLHMNLTPVLGTPGKPLRCKLVLLDKFNREFFVGPIEFPYIGPTP